MNNSAQKNEYVVALGIAIVMLAVFVLLQKVGLVHLVSGGDLGYGAIFLIGAIASLSTCMAVVGGLLLSLSANSAQEGKGVLPQVYFHIGRLGGFFVLGGVIGLLGTAFTLSTTLTFVLNLIIGIVMLILGAKLLDVPLVQKVRISFPKVFRARVEGVRQVHSTFTPLLVGVATFFMPCGFTQSMQLYSLGTGDFVSGALTMFVFALGTFPVLALMSFGSHSLGESRYAGIFYKTAGLIVIVFALMNIINSLVVAGLISPVFTL